MIMDIVFIDITSHHYFMIISIVEGDFFSLSVFDVQKRMNSGWLYKIRNEQCMHCFWDGIFY